MDPVLSWARRPESHNEEFAPFAPLWFSPKTTNLASMSATPNAGQKNNADLRTNAPDRTAARQKIVDELALRVRQEVRERLGPNPTFEQRRDAEAELLSEVLWKREDEDLRESVATTDSVQINGKAYKRLEQPSSATYYGRWGKHFVEERGCQIFCV